MNQFLKKNHIICGRIKRIPVQKKASYGYNTYVLIISKASPGLVTQNDLQFEFSSLKPEAIQV